MSLARVGEGSGSKPPQKKSEFPKVARLWGTTGGATMSPAKIRYLQNYKKIDISKMTKKSEFQKSFQIASESFNSAFDN